MMPALRHWAFALAFTALAGGAASASPREVTPREITIVANNAKLDAANALRTEFLHGTDGRIAVDVRVGPTLGSEGDLVTAVRKGEADIALLTGAVIPNAVPLYGVFDVPFLFRDAAQARRVIAGPVEARIAEAFPKSGLVLLGIGEQGFRDITNSKRPIVTPADLHGLTMRVIPNDLYKMAFEAFGARVVPMDFTLLHAALIDGRVDGQENPTSSVWSSGFQDAQRYLSLSHHVYSTVGIIMNKDTYDTLGPEDRAALAAAVQVARARLQEGADKDNAASLAELRKAGMVVNDHVERDAFLAALAPLEPEFDKRFGHDLLEQIRQTP
jgi:TRAP-type transport system periplasmic protein